MNNALFLGEINFAVNIPSGNNECQALREFVKKRKSVEFATMKINELPNDQRIREGAFVAKVRAEKGISQIELAEMMGVGQGYVSKWESGTKPIHPERLFQLSKILGFDVFELRPELKDHYRDHSPSAIESELFSLISLLPKKVQEGLLNQIKIQSGLLGISDNSESNQ